MNELFLETTLSIIPLRGRCTFEYVSLCYLLSSRIFSKIFLFTVKILNTAPLQDSFSGRTTTSNSPVRGSSTTSTASLRPSSSPCTSSQITLSKDGKEQEKQDGQYDNNSPCISSKIASSRVGWLSHFCIFFDTCLKTSPEDEAYLVRMYG